jgi:hypothetical protein
LPNQTKTIIATQLCTRELGENLINIRYLPEADGRINVFTKLEANILYVYFYRDDNENPLFPIPTSTRLFRKNVKRYKLITQARKHP